MCYIMHGKLDNCRLCFLRVGVSVRVSTGYILLLRTYNQPTGLIMGSKAAPGEGCPRCGFAVYAAEMMLHNGKVRERIYFSQWASFASEMMLQ